MKAQTSTSSRQTRTKGITSRFRRFLGAAPEASCRLAAVVWRLSCVRSGGLFYGDCCRSIGCLPQVLQNSSPSGISLPHLRQYMATPPVRVFSFILHENSPLVKKGLALLLCLVLRSWLLDGPAGPEYDDKKQEDTT